MNGQDKYRERERFEVGGVEFFLRKIPSGGGVSAFLMMETQVTQALYEAVMGANPSHFKGMPDSPQRPVEQVSWEDGVKFANALSEKLGLRPAYEGNDNDARLAEGANGFRLPFEAEWEWAASRGKIHWHAGSDNLDAVAWHQRNSNSQTHPVGQKQANDFGLRDMTGNVSEWVADDRYNPGECRPGANERVYRGGAWCSNAGGCRVSVRRWVSPGDRFNFLGLRFCSSAPLSANKKLLLSLQEELRSLRASRKRWPEGADAEFVCFLILEGKSLEEREATLAQFRREVAERERFLKGAIKRLQ